MPSFDVVSKIDLQEVDNAVNLIMREIGNRYDFKNVKWSIEFDKKETKIIINAESEYCLEQIQGSLKGAFVKRGMEAKALDFCTPEKASGASLRQFVKIKQGVDQDTAKKIVKEIKSKKMKVQVSIQGDEVRVSGKKIDDLQEIISLVKGMNLDIPLQYVNFRN
ncbi:YajQ family cyclic di-GMP-binding protein [Pseudomonadota bacterium]